MTLLARHNQGSEALGVGEVDGGEGRSFLVEKKLDLFLVSFSTGLEERTLISGL